MSGWKDYFHFQKIERQGLFVLIALIGIIIVAINVLNTFDNSPKTDFSEFKEKIQAFETSLEEKKHSEKIKTVESKVEEEEVFFDFNPNNLPISDWMRMGLSEKQAAAIKNYEEKGGIFRDKLDVKKMYTISPEIYSKIENHILLPDVANKEASASKFENYKKKEFKKYNNIPLVIDINTADTSEFMKIRGIGPAFSSRIIKYRNSLGGFHSKEQILEVWGIDSVVYEKIQKHIILDEKIDLKRININTATADELKNHPYIDWKIANSIYKYRTQNGKYKNLDDIKKSHLIDDALYRKIVPYLRLE